MLDIFRSYTSQILMAIMIAAIFLLFIAFSSPFAIDDAYISFTYSKNLAQGNGLTYNGLVVEGYSNPLWTLLIAPFIYLNVDPLAGARILAVTAMFATFYLTWRMTQRLTVNATPFISFVVTLIVATNIAVISWTVSGLETPLFTFLLLLIVYLETQPNPGSPVPSALALLGLSLTRPEGMMLFPIVLLYHLVRGDYPIQKNLMWAMAFILPFMFFILWRLAVYGYPLPNTAYAKLDRDGTTLKAGLDYVTSFFLLRPTFTILLIMSLALLLKQGLQIARAWLLIVTVTAGFIAFALYVGGDWMPYHRFLMPIVPLLALALTPALAMPVKRLWVRLLPQILVISAVVFEIIFLVAFCGEVFRTTSMHQQFLTETAHWIYENTDPEARLAVVDAGVLAYYSERRIIDIIGLNNEHIAHSESQSSPQYILDQQPLLVQLHARRSENGQWYDPDSRAGNELIQYQLFHTLYEQVDLVIESPLGSNWFIRK